MSVVIRLKRIGKNPKKRPHFRIAVFDQRQGRDARPIEELGFYSPVTGAVKIKRERIDSWIKKGAQLSATVKNIFGKSAIDSKKEVKDATGSSAS
ncbi:MAG: 30S ribosomal protein S16 [Candidatus Omnitrophota bacterium]